MAFRINWNEIAWEEVAPGARQKTVIRANHQLRLVEFTAEFVEVGWCRKKHIGCVMEGELRIDFADSTQVYAAGDGLFILGDEAEKHRVRVQGGVARLLLVEEV